MTVSCGLIETNVSSDNLLALQYQKQQRIGRKPGRLTGKQKTDKLSQNRLQNKSNSDSVEKLLAAMEDIWNETGDRYANALDPGKLEVRF